jgi:Flp pilus assembly protein TadG
MESACGAFLVIAMAAIAVDMTIFTFAFMNLDKAARDAARAAGGQQTYTAALNAVNAAIANHVTDGYFCGPITLAAPVPPSGASTPSAPTSSIWYQDWSNSYPATSTTTYSAPVISGSANGTQQCAYAIVRVQETIRLPVPIGFFGANITSFIPMSGITFYRQYTFPIMKTAATPQNGT